MAPALLVGAQQHRPARPARRGHAERRLPAAPRFNADEIENPNQQPIKMGEKGSGVVRAEILLDRAYFSPGQIDGDFGSNLQKAVAAYQHNEHLPSTGAIDEATWSALNRDNAPVLVKYSVSPDDVRGPFTKLPPTMKEQATLPYLGYASPLDELAERFHCSQTVLKALNPDVDIAQAGQITVPSVNTKSPGEAARIVVSKSDSSVAALDDSGKVIWYAVATIGSQHDPLPVGDWKVLGISKNPVFHYNASLFWNAPDKNEKEVIKPGPRNPVGVVWIDLSKQHYGIHGTPDPSLIGHAFSHGCIRLTNWDAWQLASMVKPGTPVSLKE
ncbi:MAG TPA: L,D-transpeptidase [Candidatus Limnocylindrales bacterium]|nr:L,D-transpeptidase [Candidatus Limnocylindrales bacterium]